MKKKIFALLLAGVMLFLLCGCDALDALRQQQAFYDAGKIVYEDVTYQLLPDCDELQPTLDYEKGMLYVTPADVPVLLTTIMAEEYLYRSEDGDFLCSSGHYTVYCREDRHAELSKIIREGFQTEMVCYEYEVFDPRTLEFSFGEYVLTEEQVTALETLTANVEPQILGEGLSLNYDWYIDLEACSEDMLFRRDGGRIAVAGSTYYLVMEMGSERRAFQVPEGMVSVFDDITEAYRDAYDYPEADRNT